MRWFALPTAGVLCGVTLYEAALAAGVIGYTGVRHPPLWASTTVLGGCLVMVVAGIVIAWVVMLDAVVILEGAAARMASTWSIAVIPCIAAAAVFARWLTPDPYYLPSTFRRLSEGGIISPQMMAAVVVLAVGSAILMRLRAGPGLWLCSISLWFSALVMLVASAGH